MVAGIEATTVALWRSWAAWQKRTTCGCCRAMRYCGQNTRRGRWLCVACFDLSVEADRFRRRLRA